MEQEETEGIELVFRLGRKERRRRRGAASRNRKKATTDVTDVTDRELASRRGAEGAERRISSPSFSPAFLCALRASAGENLREND
jgi:hypothetical protein